MHVRLNTALIIGLLLALSSCKAGTGDDRSGTKDSTNVQIEKQTYSSLFTEAVIELSRRMVEITSRVKTVADVEAVEEDVAASLARFTEQIRYIVDNLDGLVEADPEGFRDPSDLMELPEVVAARIPAEEAMYLLERDNPPAATWLAFHAEENSELAARLIDEIKLAYSRSIGDDPD